LKTNFKSSSLAPYINLKELGLTGNEDIERKTLLITGSGLSIGEDAEKTIIAEVTNTNMDHDREVVYTKGIDLSVFTKMPSICWNHDYNIPAIGKAIEMSTEPDRMLMKIKIANTTFANDIWDLIKGSYIKSCSIGFITKSKLIKGTKEFGDFIKEKGLKINDKVQSIVKECILVENSICNLPCNSDALVLAVSSKSIKISDETLNAFNIHENKYKALIKDIVKELYTEIKKDDEEDIDVTDMGELGANDDKIDDEVEDKIVVIDKIEVKDANTVVLEAKDVKEVKAIEVVEVKADVVVEPVEPVEPIKVVEPVIEPKVIVEEVKAPIAPISIKILRYGWDKEKDVKEARDLLKGKIL
jgi:phage head maturation protease